MNTMPQAFDARPITRAGFSVAGPRVARSRAEAHLKLVVGTAEAAVPPAAAAPYGLNGRRHLASVPTPPATATADPQATPAGADNAGMAAPWASRHLEPLAFALVLLVSVAALAVAMRAA